MAQDRFVVHLERSGGFAGFNSSADVDSADLSEPDAAQLQALLGAVDFTQPAPPPRGADRFQYDIAVERGGRLQSLTAYDGAMPPPVKALTDWLLAFARRPTG